VSRDVARGSYKQPVSRDVARGSYKLSVSRDVARGSYKQPVSRDVARGSYKQPVSRDVARGSYKQSVSRDVARGSYKQSVSRDVARGSYNQSGPIFFAASCVLYSADSQHNDMEEICVEDYCLTVMTFYCAFKNCRPRTPQVTFPTDNLGTCTMEDLCRECGVAYHGPTESDDPATWRLCI
jgi:hypothetical protein